MGTALLATGFAATLGRSATFSVAADPSRHASAEGVIGQGRPIETVALRITDLAIVLRVVRVRFDRLALDFALIRAVDVGALDAIATFGGRAAVPVATDPAVAAEGVIG